MYRNNDNVSSDEEVLEEYRKLLKTGVEGQKSEQNQSEIDFYPSTSRVPHIRESVLSSKNPENQNAKKNASRTDCEHGGYHCFCAPKAAGVI